MKQAISVRGGDPESEGGSVGGVRRCGVRWRWTWLGVPQAVDQRCAEWGAEQGCRAVKISPMRVCVGDGSGGVRKGTPRLAWDCPEDWAQVEDETGDFGKRWGSGV
jgi:hypothetical protein